MDIKVLGSGCPTCKTMYEMVVNSVKEMGLDNEVEYVTDINLLIQEGLATSPALKINDKIVVAGRVPSLDEIRNFITEAQKGNEGSAK